jgi:hypothetical protein
MSYISVGGEVGTSSLASSSLVLQRLRLEVKSGTAVLSSCQDVEIFLMNHDESPPQAIPGGMTIEVDTNY